LLALAGCCAATVTQAQAHSPTQVQVQVLPNRGDVPGAMSAVPGVALAAAPNTGPSAAMNEADALLANSLAAVAPLRVARGIQNKVLEAMAMSRPTLVSAMGLEGITAQAGTEVLLAETAGDYGVWVDALLAGKYGELGARARHRVLAEFDWENNLKRVDAVLEKRS
jgi:glycosyltransferase involved in cell wall biosynthesis